MSDDDDIEEYMKYLRSLHRSKVNSSQIHKKAYNDNKSKKGDIKAAVNVLILTFYTVIDNDSLGIIFNYLGEETIVMAKNISKIGIGSFKFPGNFTTPANTLEIIKHVSTNKGTFKVIMEWFLSLSVLNQEYIISYLSVDQIIKWFHVPSKRISGIKKALSEPKQEEYIFNPDYRFQSDLDMFYPPRRCIQSETKHQDSKLHRFKEAFRFSDECRKTNAQLQTVDVRINKK